MVKGAMPCISSPPSAIVSNVYRTKPWLVICLNIAKLECPCCGATLDVNDELDIFYCKYCGSKLIAEDLDKGRLKARLKIYELQQQERMQQSEHEFQQHEIQEERKQRRFEAILEAFDGKLVPLVLAVILLVAMHISTSLPSSEELEHDELVAELKSIELEIQSDIKSGNYDEALLKTKQLVLDDNWSSKEEKTWAQKRKEYEEVIREKIQERDSSNPDYMYAPKSSKEFKKLTGQQAFDLFTATGFTNVSIIEVPDDSGFLVFGKKSGKVEHVNFGGLTDFTTSDSCKLDDKIVIYCYEE